ncbi:MAG: hypothetical protein ABI664_07395 [bacterium]
MRQLALAMFAIGIVIANPPAAEAQLSELQPGSRVRVQAPGVVAGWLEGTVLTRASDTIVVGGPNASPVHLPIARISAVEISRGLSRGDGAIRGMKWGVPIMATIGAVLAAVGTDGNCSTCDMAFGDGVYVTALFSFTGAFYGAGIGALIGRERWEQFDLGTRTSVRVQGGRIGLGLEFAF